MLLLAQNQIDHPTAAHMLARLAAVIQNVGIGAARFFESIREDGQAIESRLLVDRFLGSGFSTGGTDSRGDASWLGRR